MTGMCQYVSKCPEVLSDFTAIKLQSSHILSISYISSSPDTLIN